MNGITIDSQSCSIFAEVLVWEQQAIRWSCPSVAIWWELKRTIMRVVSLNKDNIVLSQDLNYYGEAANSSELLL